VELILPVLKNIPNLMRQCSYFFGRKQGDEIVFVRILGTAKSGYPRFHAHVKLDKVSQQTYINLHLDQKKPSYQGTPAHSAEYESEVVREEAARIKQIIEGR
jgi:hypothetical protein